MAGEKILVVDDEPGVREALAAILADDGYDVDCVGTGEDGVEAIEKAPYDAVLLDVWLPGIDGLDTLSRLKELRPDAEVVMISGHGTIETAVRATRNGAFDFIEKPLSLEKTLLVLRNALRQRRLERANRELLAQLARDTEILGRSASVEELRRNVDVASTSDAPVLISGRHGSGRETVARRIHAGGPRGESTFVEVPCAALDTRAAELALYGNGEGTSRIELSRGGTLFLEDAERLPEGLQVRLAATLVEKLRESPSPRVIASVTRPEELHDDLLNQLDVIRLAVPGLRERREDIPTLVERFMLELAREYGRAPRRFDQECLSVLQSWDWPGEMRELRNLVERLLLFAGGEVVGVSDLPESMGGVRSPDLDLYGEFETLEAGTRAFRTHLVRRTLARENGDEEAAANRLGIDVTLLRSLR